MTEVQKLAFKDLYLVRINLSHNAIERIESGAFENCANITLLDLSHNKIESIPRTAFDSSTYATELDLSYNLLTDLSQVLGRFAYTGVERCWDSQGVKAWDINAETLQCIEVV